jgi:hypothetical protein
LNSVVVRDELLGITRVIPGIMAPGANFTFFFPSTATSELINVAEATGNPVFSDGRTIPGLEPVQSVDPSAVGLSETNANIKVDNRVYLGFNRGASCASATIPVEVRVNQTTNCLVMLVILLTLTVAVRKFSTLPDFLGRM